MADGGKYQKALEELEKSRPAFIVEPQVCLRLGLCLYSFFSYFLFVLVLLLRFCFYHFPASLTSRGSSVLLFSPQFRFFSASSR